MEVMSKYYKLIMNIFVHHSNTKFHFFDNSPFLWLNLQLVLHLLSLLTLYLHCKRTVKLLKAVSPSWIYAARSSMDGFGDDNINALLHYRSAVRFSIKMAANGMVLISRGVLPFWECLVALILEIRQVSLFNSMGLLTILKKMKQKEKEVRILMLYPFTCRPV